MISTHTCCEHTCVHMNLARARRAFSPPLSTLTCSTWQDTELTRSPAKHRKENMWPVKQHRACLLANTQVRHDACMYA